MTVKADSPVAALLGLLVFLGGLAAFGVAVSAARGTEPRDLALLLLPAAAFVLAQPFTTPPGRRTAAAVGGGLLALPAALLALA